MAISAAHDGSELIGEVVGDRYRIEKVVGAGGMATVYKAFDSTLERPVALKVMRREVTGDPDQLERFRREARAAAKLSHAHIVTVIDAGEENDRPYIVFEYVPGETLKQRIKSRGRLPVTEAVAYAIEIGSALVAAHGAGLVHRDVKPQNVLLDSAGHAKVADFGIARELEANDGLTKTGRVLGTTDYVAPEQAMGEDVTGQSDVYSLGIVLFEMLTGEVPFKGENHVAVAMKHVKEQLPDVQRLRPEISSTLAAVIEKTCWRSRPRAPAARPARRPSSSTHCPSVRGAWRRPACRIPRARALPGWFHWPRSSASRCCCSRSCSAATAASGLPERVRRAA
jgi:serine/threonine protein kinase